MILCTDYIKITNMAVIVVLRISMLLTRDLVKYSQTPLEHHPLSTTNIGVNAGLTIN
jgi:hypothetical protein